MSLQNEGQQGKWHVKGRQYDSGFDDGNMCGL